MNKCLAFVFVLATLQVSLASPRPRRASQPATPAKTQIEQLASDVTRVATDVSNSLAENLPNTEEVTNALSKGSKDLADGLQGIITKLDEEIKKGDVNKVVKDAADKISEALTSLQDAAGPKASAQAETIRKNIDDNLKKTNAEIEKLVKTVQPDLQRTQESVQKFSKSLLDDFLAATQNLQAQVKAALESSKPK